MEKCDLTAVPEDIKKFKKENNWLAILQYYNMQDLSAEDFPDIPLTEKSEILFAAKKWCDDIESRANNKAVTSQAMSRYIWVSKMTDKLLKENIENITILKSYAYLFYDIYSNLGYRLGKKSKEYKIPNELSKQWAGLRGRAFGEAYDSFDKICHEDPSDWKSIYRFARLNRKQLETDAYRETKAHNQGWYGNAVSNYMQVIQHCKGVPGTNNEYIKSLYGLAKIKIDTCDSAFFFEQQYEKMVKGEKTYASNPTIRGLEWNSNDLKEAEEALNKLFTELKLPLTKDGVEENLDEIAKKDITILPMFPYYTMAKMHWTMAKVYTSGVHPFWKLRKNNPKAIEDGYKKHIREAKRFCEHAMDIRDRRKVLGFTDADGATKKAEIELYMQIIIMDPDEDISTIEDFVNRNKWDENIKYYYGTYLIYSNDVKKIPQGIDLLTNLRDTTKNKNLSNKIERALKYVKKEEPKEKPQTTYQRHPKKVYGGYHGRDGNFYPDWLGGIESEEDFWEHTE